ncbi:MAG: flagellar export protein FliJ [Candidatus Kapaibacterium sp.]|jgi:flagellar FliJ protein|nr:flagellar export protein FliJ [Candidatus Kapabacteria bacterium]
MGKIFTFQLQHVLHLREYAVSQAKIALGEVITLRESMENSVNEKSIYLQSMKQDNEVTIITDLQMYAHHRMAVREEIESLKSEIKKLQELENIRRNDLNKKLQEKKVVEKLRERKKMEYDKKNIAEEQRFMDEIANGMSIRKSIERHR